MKRIQVNLTDDLEERVGLFMNLQGIKLWAKGTLKLVDIGLKNYLNEDIKEMSNNLENLNKKIDALSSLLNKLIISVETSFEKLNKSHE